MKTYYIGLYVLISVAIIYWFSTFLIEGHSIEPFQEISDYQSDSTFLKALEGKDMKPKTRTLNFKSPILPQLEGTYMGMGEMKDTYWKIDKNGNITSVYGSYGTITVSSPQKVQDGFVYLNFKDKTGKNATARSNGSQYLMELGSAPFILQLIDDPTIAPMELSNVGPYIGTLKGGDNVSYTISKEGILSIIGTNQPMGQLSYASSGPPYQDTDGTYTFKMEYIDSGLQQKWGADSKKAVLSRTELRIYDADDKLLITYTKVLSSAPAPAAAPAPTQEFGFQEVNAPILDGCKASPMGETNYYDRICINKPYYIINYEQLLCLTVGPDGKTLMMKPVDKNNSKQIWIPRQYRIEDRYNYYDHPWCQADLEAEEEARSIKYSELKGRGKWMRPETIYPRNPPRNKILQSKIDYRINDNNGDFLLESSTSRSFVKGQFNPKSTLLDLSLIPATIRSQKRKGFDYSAPIYENISPSCLYECNASRQERDRILESDSYALDQERRNCAGDRCAQYIDPPCQKWDRNCYWEPWYYERDIYISLPFGIQIPVGTRRTYGGQRWACGSYYCANDPPAYCNKYKCADTRTQQFTGKYPPIECNDKYDNYDQMTRFRFERNLLEVVTRVEDKYNSLAVKNRQFVEANNQECLITYSEANTDPMRQKRTWYFIPVDEIDRIIPKLKERKRNLPLEKQIAENVKKIDTQS